MLNFGPSVGISTTTEVVYEVEVIGVGSPVTLLAGMFPGSTVDREDEDRYSSVV
jgi:hypothetical protein